MKFKLGISTAEYDAIQVEADSLEEAVGLYEKGHGEFVDHEFIETNREDGWNGIVFAEPEEGEFITKAQIVNRLTKIHSRVDNVLAALKRRLVDAVNRWGAAFDDKNTINDWSSYVTKYMVLDRNGSFPDRHYEDM